MKVKELIESLRNFNPDLEIVYKYDGWRYPTDEEQLEIKLESKEIVISEGNYSGYQASPDFYVRDIEDLPDEWILLIETG